MGPPRSPYDYDVALHAAGLEELNINIPVFHELRVYYLV